MKQKKSTSMESDAAKLKAGERSVVQMIHVAKLDDDRVYWGVLEISADALTDDHVVVPVDCDLIPGGYQYDVGHKAFLPLAKLRTAESFVSNEQALFEVLQILEKDGLELSPLLIAWRTAFQKSIDYQQTIDGGKPA